MKNVPIETININQIVMFALIETPKTQLQIDQMQCTISVQDKMLQCSAFKFELK